MTMEQFIEENRAELVDAISGSMGSRTVSIDDEDIENWILNDEGLYNWAMSAGVDDV